MELNLGTNSTDITVMDPTAKTTEAMNEFREGDI
jgi:hypothetical protein